MECVHLHDVLRRVAYHGRQQLATPLAIVVRDAAGHLHRAEYVDASLIVYGVAHYRVGETDYWLQPSGLLVPVDSTRMLMETP